MRRIEEVSLRNYAAISSLDELRERFDSIHGTVFGFDIETGYLGPDKEKASVHPETAILVGFSFTNSTNWARYVPLAHDAGDNLPAYEHQQVALLLWNLLNTGLGVAHNAAFELRHLAKWFREHLSDHPVVGEAVRRTAGYYPVRSDTQVEAYLQAEFQRFGLKALTKSIFDHTMIELYELFDELPVNKRKYLRFNTLEITPRVIAYACEDSLWCLAIHQRYYPLVKDRLLYTVEMAIVETCLPSMEDYGIAYDWAMMRRVANELRLFRDRFNAEIMAELSERTGETIAINLGSAKQVSEVLFDKLGYRTSVYTDKTRDLPFDQRKMSTGDIALTKLAQQHQVVKMILQWRNQTKLLGTYLDKYENVYNYADDGRVHASHLSAFVITGRFAVSDPNYQQSPKKYHFDLAEAREAHARGEEPPPGSCFKFNFRDVIIAPEDHYIFGFDLSQAELRAIAGEAQEWALLKAFELGEDVHRLTASLMLGVPLDEVTEDQRSIGKTMNFALLYGMGVKSLADRLGLPIEEAQSLMDKYFAGYPNIATWSAKQVRHGKEHGYVTTRFGRKLPIWEYQSDKDYIRQKGDRACVNYPIQGAATGDYMKIAMVRAQAFIRSEGYADRIHMVMNVHDALEFYVHRSVPPKDAIAILKDAVIFGVPGWPTMKADWHIARRWGSPTDIEIGPDGDIVTERDEPSAPIESGRTVVVVLAQNPVPSEWAEFENFLSEIPGQNPIKINTPDGEVELRSKAALTPAHVAQVSRIFGLAEVTWETDDADVSQLAAGLTL